MTDSIPRKDDEDQDSHYHSGSDDVRFEFLDDEILVRWLRLEGGGARTAEVRVSPGGLIMPASYMSTARAIRNMRVSHRDVWVVSFPKCGTTWVQEMVWLLCNQCDFDKAKTIPLPTRFPFLDSESLGHAEIVPVDSLSPPRFIKSHISYELLPKQLWKKKPKIVYVYRNPKDAAISFYHHYKIWRDFSGTMEEFLEAFLADRASEAVQEIHKGDKMHVPISAVSCLAFFSKMIRRPDTILRDDSQTAGKVIYCPFWDHVLKFWNARDSSNILFLKYEDMKEDLLREIRRTERFLDVTIPPGVEKELLDHLSFERMKKNPSVNYDEMLRARDKSGALFMRRGESGRWAQEMSPYFAKTFDAWAAQRLRGTNFPYYS